MKYDMVIKNGTIIDGSGKQRYKADLGVKDGRIATIGSCAESEVVIDAEGLFVAPGFIDGHSHSDWSILVHPTGDSKIRQGITTDLSGLCGYSAAPIYTKEWYKMLYVRMTVGWSMHYAAAAYNWHPLPYGREIEVDWATLRDYLQKIEDIGISLNYGMLVGHGSLRYYAMGLEARIAWKEDLDRMKEMLEEAMQQGAFGMSAGLSGCPGCWANTEELVELCKIVREYDGVYMPHQRSSRQAVHLEETIRIAEESGCRTCMSHTRLNQQTKDILDNARAKGIDITFDYFPYPGSIAGNIVYMLPHWLSRHREDGFNWIIEKLKDPSIRREFVERDYPQWVAQQFSIPGQHTHTFQSDNTPQPKWGSMQLQSVVTTRNQKLIGKTFAEIAALKGVDPWEAWFDIICEEKGYVRWCELYGESSEDMYNEEVEWQLRVPYGCIESDSPIESPRGVTISSVDPRSYGTYPLVLEEYVNKRHVLSWEEAIKKMTYNPASAIGLIDRGLIKEGYWADLVIIDPNIISTNANFKTSLELSRGINIDIYPKGIEYTIVNGTIVNEHGRLIDVRPGRVLRNSK